ncbi:hypothetical protein VTJ49DRAFT_7051 [Mycothermus thermophilus]|uniref:Uncharacterized protein n=1 Tax=Humicola insolens TaxID=85995 RepID=A0ABR3VIX9_HUMIN
MPTLRGIEVSLATRPENERIPEYPHPEGTSARTFSEPQVRPRGDGGRAQHRIDPTVAVYMPSVPGTRFSLHYCISSPPPAPCKFIFFRLYINSRPITAWGVDPVSRPRGQVAQSLWAPGGIYEGLDGFESRNFVFLPGDETKSIAEDGGIIEIRAFRAKDRRARFPRLEEFRYQENYGISTPSMGLLDQPETACFYDWHLLDPKDSPFATFRLHYRSLKSLKLLNLIAEKEFELLCATGPKILRDLADTLGYSKNAEPKAGRSTGKLPAKAVDGHNESGDEATKRGVPDLEFLKSPPELFPVVETNSKLPQPSKELHDTCTNAYQQRPLPQRPLRELPVDLPSGSIENTSKRFSTASTISTADSITPSILEFIEEDGLDLNDVEIGVARVVRVAERAAAVRVERRRSEAGSSAEKRDGGRMLR